MSDGRRMRFKPFNDRRTLNNMNNSGDRIDVRCKMSEVRCLNPPITVEPSITGIIEMESFMTYRLT